MKTSMYFKYTSRSLLRGGQRTILAVFCVAVGVMAVVALQLVGFMLENSLTSNVRETNGGDIAVTAAGGPLKPSDLSFFTQLKKAGKITNYTATITTNGSLSATASSLQSFGIEAVDPGSFPLVAQPTFVQPGNGTLARLLGQNQVVVTQDFLKKYHTHLGATFPVYVKAKTGSGQTLHVKLAGVIANAGLFAQAGNFLLVSTRDYLAAAPVALQNYTTVNVTTANQTKTDAAVKAISAQFPLTSTSTVASVLKSAQDSLDMINKFLEIAGLLALLIGGVGIVNTMQVLLSRRKTEIAMLKTAGYRRRDLALLFGLEAGLLGLAGGIVGAAAAIGVSYAVHGLMQNLGINIGFLIKPGIALGGVAIGCATGLIFGLMPIVQAANIRPLNVMRDQEKTGTGGLALTISLLAILSLLFCILATIILKNDVMLGIATTYGTLAFLLILSAFLALIVLVVSNLPVPELFQSRQILLVLTGMVLSAPAFLVLPIFGFGLLAVSLLGLVIGFLPRSWKVSLKMALRNLDRRRARTVTTMLALFIGIFGIGLVVALGQDLQTRISSSLAQNAPYNLVATTSGLDTSALQVRLHTMPGLTSSRQDTFTRVQPSAINGQPLQQALPTGDERLQVAALLSTLESTSLAPNMPTVKISRGRNLNASDATTNNVIVSELLTNPSWLHMHLKVGDTLTFIGANGTIQRTATIVGVIARDDGLATFGKILAPSALVSVLGSTTEALSNVFYLKVAPAQVNAAQDRLSQIAPNASIQNLTDTATSFNQQLNSMLDMLVAIASLSVIAAVIIIANAVALAMLERRRELGILKAVGYTSGTVLSEVLIENGIIGAVGSFVAALLAAGGVALIGSQVFNFQLHMPTMVVVSLIGGSALLAMLTAALVAWSAVRVRPLEVLRYE